MAHYLTGYHVTDDYDEGMFGNSASDDEMIERIYRTAPPTVLSSEPPPPDRVHEDAKLETQYSEGSEDEDDRPLRDNGYTITEMIREAVPEFSEFADDTMILKELGKSLPSPEKRDFSAVLSKTPLNPDTPAFLPTGDAPVNKTSDEAPSNKTQSKDADIANKKVRKPPKCRNLAIESLRKIQELRKKILMTPDDFLPSVGSPQTASCAAVQSPDVSSPAVVPANLILQHHPSGAVPSCIPDSDGIDPFDKPLINFESGDGPLVNPNVLLQSSVRSKSGTPVLCTTPSRFTPEASTSLEPPVENADGLRKTPKKKKNKDFVPTAKAAELYQKISNEKKNKEVEMMSGRTKDNMLSDFIEHKLQENKTKVNNDEAD